MKKIILSLSCVFVLTVACSDTAAEGITTETVIIVKPVNYGNGVYYFDCIEKNFAMSLSVFLQDTTKQIATMCGNGSDSYGSDTGYFVVVKETN